MIYLALLNTRPAISILQSLTFSPSLPPSVLPLSISCLLSFFQRLSKIRSSLFLPSPLMWPNLRWSLSEHFCVLKITSSPFSASVLQTFRDQIFLYFFFFQNLLIISSFCHVRFLFSPVLTLINQTCHSFSPPLESPIEHVFNILISVYHHYSL